MTYYNGIIASHFHSVPKEAKVYPITLGEGNTPLIHLKHITKKYDLKIDVYCKFEGLNPTGSFKDRGMVIAVAAALAKGAKTVICASTGNTSASAAAYAARAGLQCVVILPSGKVAAGKLAQAYIHGAKVLSIKGNFDDAMNAVSQLGDDEVAIVNSINPMRIQGQKTIAYEIVQQLGTVPDLQVLPVGNAGNITAHWLGYCELSNFPTKVCEYFGNDFFYHEPEKIYEKRPQLLGVQAQGANPFLQDKIVANPETVATAIRIGNPQSWDPAKSAISESNGLFTDVSDDEILTIQSELASLEGIFCEPASAASLAGLIKVAKENKLHEIKTAVCTLTGNGLKDPNIINVTDQLNEVDCDLESIKKAINI